MRGRQAGRCCYQDESEKNGESLKFFARHTVVQRGQLSDVSAEGRGERLSEPPLPVGTLGAGGVDAGLSVQMEPVGQRDDSHVRHAGKAGAYHGLGEVFGCAAQVAAGVGHILGAGALTPALGGHVVVGAGVDYTVAGVGVGQIVARLAAVEGELHDLHARVAACGQHGLGLGGQIAQILGDDAALAQSLVHGVDEGAVRAFLPVTARSGLVPGGDGVVALEAPEMVDADDVVDGSSVFDALLPPAEVFGLMAGPVVERVAPELTVGGKGVGRTSGNAGQVDGAVGLEQLRVGPEVAGIGADVDGDVAHQLDAVAVGVGLEGVPLGVEEELHGLVVVHLIGQPLLGSGEGRRLPGAQVVGPVGETGLLLLGLNGHEEGIVLEPAALGLTESLIGRGRGSQQPVGRFMEHHGPLLVERTVIDGTHRLGRGQLSLGEEAVRCQQTEIDKVRVAGKGRKALVGAVPVARRADGEYLPVGLLCSRKEIDEGKGFISQRADAVRTRQAEDGHQNAACTHGWNLLVLTLDSACHDTLNDVLLAGHVKDDDGDDGDDDAGHHGGQLDAAIAAAEILDGHGNGAVLLDVQHQRGQQVVVPDPHRLKDGGGDHGGLEDGEDDLEEDLDGAAAVDHGSLFDLDGDALHEAGEHEHGQTGTEAQIDDADVPGGVQIEGVGGLGQGEHDHLEGDDHGEDDEQIHELAQLVVHAGKVPAGHGAAQQDEGHAGHGDDEAVAKAGQKAHLGDAVDVVAKAREGLSRRQLEDGGSGEGAFYFQAVLQDQDDGVDPEQAQQAHDDSEDVVPHFFIFRHYCCTSLERVNLSWMSEMITTMRKNTAAFA